MKKYSAIRIGTGSQPTYGDKYITMYVKDDFIPDYHEIYRTSHNEYVMLLFEIEE